MAKQDYYTDNFNKRRDFFYRNFPLKVGLERVGVKSKDVLKNSCPVCGYLTLQERNTFDICTICFWEDDGVDDFEENEESGPNHMTLKEGREILQEAKRKLLSATVIGDKLIDNLKNKFIDLDYSIEQDNLDKPEIMRLQNKIVDLLTKNKVYGLENLFNKSKPNR